LKCDDDDDDMAIVYYDDGADNADDVGDDWRFLHEKFVKNPTLPVLQHNPTSSLC